MITERAAPVWTSLVAEPAPLSDTDYAAAAQRMGVEPAVPCPRYEQLMRAAYERLTRAS